MSQQEMISSKVRTAELTFEGKADWIMPNENGAGYYRFALDTDGWTALLDNLDKAVWRNLRNLLNMMSQARRVTGLAGCMIACLKARAGMSRG